MLNNPIQQIERTQDAYAGNPEGLQKRANMSKELIDLLAMQALQSDLAAQKRNMAMQQQGNPQTVKDQLEEGLMGEYRQEAAKDLGINPSEGDVVERTGIAGQQMAQNAQMAQGPQGMPQGGGGVASQAGPVNLAGGGIVSFKKGSEEEGAVEAEADALGQFLLSNSIDPEKAEKMRQIMERIQKSKEEVRSKRRRGGAGLEEFRRSQGFDTSTDDPADDPSAAPSAGGIASLPPYAAPIDLITGKPQDLAPLPPGGGVLTPQTKPGGGVMMTPEMIKEVEETVAAAKPPTAVVPPAAPTIDPDAGIKAALEKSANLDPIEQAKARSAAVKDDLGLAEGIATLEDRMGRRERAYEETTASGMDNLIDLLTAGGRGGITGVGARSGQLRREENARRMAYEDTLDGIEDKTMTLRSTIGGKAATSYDNTMKTMLTVQQGAQNSLLTLSANEQKAIREERANNLAEARNDLSRENLLLNTIEDVEKQQKLITDTQQTVVEEFNLRYDSDLRAARKAVKDGDDNAEEELKILQNRISLEMRNDPRWVASEARQEMIDGIAEEGTARRRALQERLGGSAISGKTGDKINTALGI